jgi:drug/metabolite transporter (DMT)-like permease
MDVGVQAGLLLALATAFASIVGFLYKHRGAVESPEVEWRRPVHSTVVLFRSRPYVLGILIAMVGWGLHVAALALAPISLVQTVIAGGLVFLTVAADRLFGLSVTRREWIGVALTAIGLAFLAATFETGDGGSHSDYDTAVLVAFVAGCTGPRDPARGRRAQDAPAGPGLRRVGRACCGAARTCRSRR